MKFRTSIGLVVLVGWLTGSASAANAQAGSQSPRHDSAAPPLAMDLVQAPGGSEATWSPLKGTAVVLEFWATWCSGCVAQIPHLNELTAKFKDRPVRFISISDEDRDVVTAFLKQRPITGWVAIDKRGATFRNYAIDGRPQTALIDGDGVLRGIVMPDHLTESVVEQLIGGTLRMQPPPAGHSPVIGTEANAPLPLLDVRIRPAMPVEETKMSPGGNRTTGTRYEAWGLNLRRMLSNAYGISEVRIVLPESLEVARYDVSMTLPDNSAAVRNALLRQLVAGTFGVDVRRERRTVDVAVLRRIAGREPTVQPSEKGRPLDIVRGRAELVLNRPVLDETGLTGRYVYVLGNVNAETLADAFRRDLGLEIVADRRPIELLIVERQNAR